MAYSTNCDPDYFRSGLMDTVSYTVYNNDGSVGQITECDPLTEKFHQIIGSFTRFETERYTGQQFTTIINRKYGSTTPIWLVLVVNGLFSRTELRSGMMVRYPLKEDVDAAIRQLKLTPNFQKAIVI
jgi:hypothetical protein